jgi:hypothetical protein
MESVLDTFDTLAPRYSGRTDLKHCSNSWPQALCSSLCLCGEPLLLFQAGMPLWNLNWVSSLRIASFSI